MDGLHNSLSSRETDQEAHDETMPLKGRNHCVLPKIFGSANYPYRRSFL